MGSGKKTVIISSIGTGSGMNVLRALRKAFGDTIHIVGTDADATSAGLRLVDHAMVSPALHSREQYESFLFDIAYELAPAVLLPCYSGEIEPVARLAGKLAAAGLSTFLPDVESVVTCDDKRLFAEFARKLGLRSPRIFDDPHEAKYPAFAKPRKGSGSRMAMVVEGKQKAQTLSSDMILQEFVSGAEVTVDVYFDPHNSKLLLGARERVEVRNGQSVKARMVDHTPFLHAVRTVCTALQLRGASNFQFITSPEGPVLIEVNPRFSAGGLMLTVEAGLNIPALVVNAIDGTNDYSRVASCRPGLMMSRFYNEVIWDAGAV